MRRFKSGALFVYAFYCAVAIMCYIGAIIYDRSLTSIDSIDRFPITVLVVFAVIFGVPSIVAFGMKFLNCLCGFKLFAIGCIVIDALSISYFSIALFDYLSIFEGVKFSLNPALLEALKIASLSFLLSALPIILSLLALMSNIKSLKD